MLCSSFLNIRFFLGMADYKYIICTCCDNDYFHYLEKLVVSTGKFSKNTLLHIVLVNVPKEKAEFLKLLNPNISLEFDYIYFFSDSMKRGYCPNRKPSLMLSLMNKYDKPVLWIDVDGVVTSNEDDELLEFLKRNELSTILDEDHERLKLTDKQLQKIPHGPLKSPYFGIFLASVIGTNNTLLAKEFFAHVAELVKDNPYAWFSDQEALYLAYLKFKNEINFESFPKKLADEGNYGSLICFAKGPSKAGPFKDIGNALIWNHFNMEENIKIDYDKIHLSDKIVTNIRLPFKVKNLLKHVFKVIFNQILEKSKLKNKTASSVLRGLDWYFSKLILRKRYIKRKVRDFDMILDTKVPGISKTLAIYRNREEDMSELICRALKPGMTALDCGSNIGYYSLLEANLVKETGSVICIEPDPRNYELLNINLDKSPLSKIFTSHHMAISDTEGEVHLNITKFSNLNKVSRSNENLSGSHYTIPSNSIDELIVKHNWNLDFLRMDIEGHEVEVFKGMRKSLHLLKSGFTVFLEVHPNEYSEEHSFEKELRLFWENGFYCRYLVSAGVPMPPLYAKYGYIPSETIVSDGFERGIYTNITNIDHIVALVCDMPKSSRYVMLTKR